MIHEYGAVRKMKIEKGKPRWSENPYPNATSSVKNLTLPDLGLNPGNDGGKPTIKPLNCGTAYGTKSCVSIF
jgi:hypothetical protein